MSASKKGENGKQSSKQGKPPQPTNQHQQKGSKPSQSHPTVYDMRTKSFVPVPVIHKTIVHNVVYVNSTSNARVNIFQNQQKPTNDKPKHNQKNENHTQKSNPASQPKKPQTVTFKNPKPDQVKKPHVQFNTPSQPKQPKKGCLKASKHIDQPGKSIVQQPKPHVQQTKITVHKHIHIH